MILDREYLKANFKNKKSNAQVREEAGPCTWAPDNVGQWEFIPETKAALRPWR